MQENFLHFLSLTECQLNINGKHAGCIDNINNLEIDVITKTEKIFVTYNPISTNNKVLSYTFQLNTQNTPASDNEYIKIIPFPNNHYDIIMSPFYYYQIDDAKVLLNEQLGKYFLTIATDNVSRINIYSGSSIVFTLNTIKMTSVKAELKNEILTIEGIVDSNTYYLLILDTSNFKILYNDISHSIDNSEDYIQSLKNIKDISHHSLVFKINKKDKSIENYKVYENNEYKEPHSNLLIPRVFLESIQNNDEKLSKKYLSPNFSSTPFNKFINYFGEIKDIYLNRHLVLQDKLNYTIYSDKYHNYNFIMNNNKIIDIEEIF